MTAVDQLRHYRRLKQHAPESKQTMTSGKARNLEQNILRCSRSGSINDLRALFNEYGEKLLSWRHPRSGESLLLLCARYGRVELLRYLVEELDESLEQQNNDGKRALHEAAHGRHLNCVRYIVKKTVEVDCLKRADWTPLMLACTKNNLDVIFELVSAGANPLLVNKDGWSSFHIAVREGHTRIIQYLLQVYPSIWNTVSNNGRTPLHTAALHGHAETVSILLKCGDYVVDCADSCGTTPLMDALKGGHISVASLLITQHHDDVRALDNLGRQCIHISSQSGSLPALRYLINEFNVNVRNAVDYSGLTALHIAAKEGHDEAVAYLLSAGSEVNSRDKYGRTALHLSSASGRTATVKVLLETSDVDVKIQDKDGLTAEDLALKPEIRELFTRR